MNNFGIQTFDASGNIVFDSTASNSPYFHLKSSPGGDYTYIGERVAVVSPKESTYISKTGYRTHIARVVPRINAGVKYDPSITYTRVAPDAGSLSVLPVSNSVDCFGPAVAPTDFGFCCFGEDGVVQISNLLKHATIISSGTATAVSIDTPDGWFDQCAYIDTPSGVTASPSTTISFPPQDNPPLIFITYSSGYMSLHNFVFDANGKCIGAAFTSPLVPTQATGGLPTRGMPVGETSCTFNYFVVNSTPQFDLNATEGIQVFGADGQMVFDQTIKPLKILSLGSRQQTHLVLYINSVPGSTTPPVQIASTGITGAALCINPFMALSGVVSYPCWGTNYVARGWWSISSDGYYWVSALCGYGDYIKVENGSAWYAPAYTNCIGAQQTGYSASFFGSSGVGLPVLMAQT